MRTYIKDIMHNTIFGDYLFNTVIIVAIIAGFALAVFLPVQMYNLSSSLTLTAITAMGSAYAYIYGLNLLYF